jgi:hypothetical protein
MDVLRRALDYFRIAGLDAPAAMAAVCLRWAVPAPGRVGLAACAAFFIRSARWIGVSVDESSE